MHGLPLQLSAPNPAINDHWFWRTFESFVGLPLISDKHRGNRWVPGTAPANNSPVTAGSLNPFAESRAPLIFIVHEDSHVGPVLQFILERQGFRVTLLATALAASNSMDAAVAPPALVLLNAAFAGADGQEALRGIRQRPGWNSVPVLMLSAVATGRLGNNRCAPIEYFSKPFDPREVVARIERLLKEER